MPQRWLHNLIDIIIQGKHIEAGFWKYHKYKDEPSKWLGIHHRKERHDDYLSIIKKLEQEGIHIQANNPYQLLNSFARHNIPKNFKPDTREIVGLTHEFIDVVWSSLSKNQKLSWVTVFKDLMLNPTNYFQSNILEPEDLELEEYKVLKKYILSKKIEELI